MKRPISVPGNIADVLRHQGRNRDATVAYVNQLYFPRKFRDPDVSIIIPAYNEADFIALTILSLCRNITQLNFEIIVINNNSTDETEALVRLMGVRYMNESVQGIVQSRNAGLGAARAKIVLSADADTIYPPEWIDAMAGPLLRYHDVAVTYGTFAFLPQKEMHRLAFFLYENCADFSRWMVRRFGEEAINVYGFNFGFRMDQGLAVDWFNHPRGAREDGWMALKLRDKGFGKLFLIRGPGALVWTSDRKIQEDGGLLPAFRKRVLELITGKILINLTPPVA